MPPGLFRENGTGSRRRENSSPKKGRAKRERVKVKKRSDLHTFYHYYAD
jgi:hypothetical protein